LTKVKISARAESWRVLPFGKGDRARFGTKMLRSRVAVTELDASKLR
jgi:hypothetical protein